jgi:transcription initiation factor TFIID subunit TAF12
MHFRRVQNNSHQSCRHNEARLERLSKHPTQFSAVLTSDTAHQRRSVDVRRNQKTQSLRQLSAGASFRGGEVRRPSAAAPPGRQWVTWTNCRKMQAAFASPKASRPAPVVAPGEPEEVVITAKKSRSRNSLEANWREDRTALVSTFGYLLRRSFQPKWPKIYHFDL